MFQGRKCELLPLRKKVNRRELHSAGGIRSDAPGGEERRGAVREETHLRGQREG